jgi:hypothetical protein
MIFNNAKQKDFFKNQTKVSISLLNQIKCLTSSFEVSERSKKEWKYAILKGYSLFNELVNNNGGRIHFNMIERTAVYEN